MSTKGLRRSLRRDMLERDQRLKDALTLTPALASKMASVAVHAAELLETGEEFDRIALSTTLQDPELKAWIKVLGPLAPLKRTRR